MYTVCTGSEYEVLRAITTTLIYKSQAEEGKLARNCITAVSSSWSVRVAIGALNHGAITEKA